MPTLTRHLPELLQIQADRFGPRRAILHRRHGLYGAVSWREFHERVTAAAAGLIEQAVAPGDRVAVLSENRLEWILADQAILACGAVTVPLHAPLSSRQILQQLSDSGSVGIIVSTADQASKIHNIQSALPALRFVVRMDEPCGPSELTWEGLSQRGRHLGNAGRNELARRQAALSSDDLATLMYTSGTTGQPKGVMLTHGNFLANATALQEICGPFATDSMFFNWLPLSHVYARTADYYLALLSGIPLALAESADSALANLREVGATHVSSVPRFYEKVLAAVAALPERERPAKLRQLFGPRMVWLGCGGAAMPVAVAQAYRDAGLNMVVGYGLTESSPVIASNRRGANKLGTVGQALPNVKVKIGPDGEILTRGPHVMKGYWKQPEATAFALKDGWLGTGDLGSLDAEGYLTITGRKKDLLVLSNGKKVVPTAIESLLAAEPCVEQAVVFGESKPYLTALIVPCWDVVRRELAARGVAEFTKVDDWTTRDETKALLMEQIERCLADVAAWEKVREIVIVTQAFSLAREELTVSLKLRRDVVFEHYRAALEGLYSG